MSQVRMPAVIGKLYNARQAVDLVMLMMLIGREAGNQTDEAMLAVAWTVRNRVLRPGFWNWGTDWETVMEARWQYSSINGSPADPNLQKYPNLHVEPWERCLAIAELVYNGEVNDPTQGATHYYDASLELEPPNWARSGKLEKTVDIGAFHFFRVIAPGVIQA
ncbi:MAG: cell wall hydrolase [Acidobacteria bacterium Pan2503]|uniref:Cell wall hydrolase n=1 Tax=Candidatus Acidiferrum panamense TaxID=2741543 RepID=A0A7V8SZQ3_9BACT|nr:cell wall hydrolase [Candidatus Acidoferrum panamensis]